MTQLLCWAQQHAWLSAPRKSSDGKSVISSRWSLLQVAGEPVPLPETGLSMFERWFLDVGPMRQTAGGLEPIGWADLNAWLANGFSLTLDEKRLILRMSAEYLDWFQRGADPQQSAPWVDDQ